MNDSKGNPQQERIQVGRVYILRTKASPKWYVEYCHEGRQVRRTTGTTAKKEARRVAEETSAKLTLGQLEAPAKARNDSVASSLSRWLAWLPSQSVSASTVANYTRPCREIEYWSNQYLGREPRLKDLSSDLMLEFESVLRATGVVIADSGRRRKQGRPNGAATIHGKMEAIRRFIKWSADYGLVGVDPCPKYRVPGFELPKIEVYTEQEIDLLLADPDPNLADIWLAFLRTGMRAEELCWLTKEDVDIGTGGVWIRKKTCPITGQPWQPKHGHERVIPVADPAMIRALERQMKRSPQPWVFWCGDNWKSNGGRWREARLLTRLRRRQKEAGITHGVLHTFRHTCLTHLANQAQIPIAHVMMFAGHQDLKVTQRYLHIQAGDVASSMAQIQYPSANPVAPEKEVKADGGDVGKN